MLHLKAIERRLNGRHFIDEREAAEILGKSVRTLERWRRHKKRTGEFIGPVFIQLRPRGVRYPTESFLLYLRESYENTVHDRKRDKFFVLSKTSVLLASLAFLAS